jgi:phosphoribosyl 1,2-cyclic phosphodiesterase
MTASFSLARSPRKSLPRYDSAAGSRYDERSREVFRLKFCVLASSSSGNSAFLASGNTRILIDAGLSRKQTFERLAAIGEDPGLLDAVFITHEHSDHVVGLPAIVKGFKDRRLPVYLTRLTAPQIDWNGAEPELHEFQAGASIDLGEVQVQSFTIPHDAADPVGYAVTAGAIKASVVTDLGYIPENVKFHMQGSQLLLLESNHDASMLQVGPVPWSVKQRILSRKGHLSNSAACDYIGSELPEEVANLLLGHLSQNHNDPCIAEIEAKSALGRRRMVPDLTVLERGQLSKLFHL